MSCFDIVEIDRKACDRAMQLINLYYEVIDRRRERLSFMYMDKASLVWNGNCIYGSQAIGQFLSSIPETEHEIQSIDVQQFSPFASASLGGDAMTALIAGTVRINDNDHLFNQTMVLVMDSEAQKPMIVSDRFRYID